MIYFGRNYIKDLKVSTASGWGGPLPLLQTSRGKEPFSRRGGMPKKERVIVSGRTLAPSNKGLRCRRSGIPIIEGYNRRAQSSALFGSLFLDNPGWDSRWFHRPGAPLPAFRSWEPCPDRTFGDYL